MLISRYEPFRNLQDLERRFFSQVDNSNGRNNLASFAPTVNTRETDGAYHVEVDLPGVTKEDVQIDVHENIMTIYGERRHKKEVTEEDYYKTESYFGKFQRSFTLPDSVDSDTIAAKFDHGVLEVDIPKVAPKEARKIAIN